jgi:hypothetical protein
MKRIYPDVPSMDPNRQAARRSAGRTLAAFILAAPLLSPPIAFAAGRETAFGFGGTNEVGNDVIATRTCGPGTLVVGTGTLFTGGALYLIRADANGTKWEKLYRFARGTIPLVNAAVVESSTEFDPSFYVVGTLAPPNAPTRLVLVSLDCNGNVRFARTYDGGTSSATSVAGNDVIEARTTGVGASIGDLIVAGRIDDAAPGSHAALFRIRKSDGVLVFAHAYENESGGYQEFKGLTNAGRWSEDVVAVGRAGNSVTQPYAVRVDAATGLISRPDHCAAVGRERDSMFEAVTELRSGPHAGDLVMVGTNFLGATMLLVRTAPSPCLARQETYPQTSIGEVGWAFAVREVPAGVPGMPKGTVAVAGRVKPGGAPNSRAFLLLATPNELSPIAGHLYAGGYQWQETYASGIAFANGQLVLAGSRRDLNRGGVSDVYRVDVGADGRTSCSERWAPSHHVGEPFARHVDLRARAVGLGTSGIEIVTGARGAENLRCP